MRPMTSQRIFKYTGLLLAVLLAVIVTYYAGAVYAARRYTVEVLLPKAQAAGYPLTTSDLTRRQLDILLKVTDPRFFSHTGFDFSTAGTGGVTLSQRVAGTMYFEHFEPGLDTLKQSLIAAGALDPLMPKAEQLRVFINTVYLGPAAHGFEQAAQLYFHKPFKQLGEEEYLALVAMIVAPEVFNIREQPERNAERVTRIRSLVAGQYKPRGLCDVYYGKLDPEVQKGLPALSYFRSCYE
jgi:membrane carboxypeptidase/penicillin-binding protein PbpC